MVRNDLFNERLQIFVGELANEDLSVPVKDLCQLLSGVLDPALDCDLIRVHGDAEEKLRDQNDFLLGQEPTLVLVVEHVLYLRKI